MRWVFLCLVFAVFAAPAFAAAIDSCQNLSNASTTYTLNTSLAINGSTCFTVTAQNVTLDCNGYSITGNNATGTYGIYTNQFNTTIKNCNIGSFQHAIVYDTSSNGTINNVNTTLSHLTGVGIYLNNSANFNTINNSISNSSYYYGIYLASSSSNTIANSSGISYSGFTYGIVLYSNSNSNTIRNTIGTSTYGSGILIHSSSNNTITNSTGSSNSAYGVYLFSSSSNTISNSTVRSSSSISLNMSGSNSNTVYNNTLISDNGTGNLLYIDSTSGGSTFYWNNFSATSGLYVDDTNGTNRYNTTVSGHGEGNIWRNVMNGSVQITGTNNSAGFPNLYYGTNGSGYPYNSTNAQGKLSGNVVDFAPLTPQLLSGGGNGTNGSISGFVRYSNNSTVANAAVSLNMTGVGLINTTNSSANGSYSFTNLNYSSIGVQYVLYAAKDGNSSVPDPITLNTSSYAIADRNISLITGGGSPPPSNGTNGSISGFVKYSNSTAAYANVSLTGSMNSSTLSNATNGFYQFSNLAWPGGYVLQAREVGNPNVSSGTLDLNLTSGNYNPTNQNLTLSDGSPPPGGNGTNGTISGRVFMPDGSTPVAGANVSLTGSTNANALTNSSGDYSFTNLSWPSGFGLQARGGPGMENKMSNFFSLNLDGSNYTLTQNLNLMDQGGGSCSHNGTYSVSGFVRVYNSSGVLNNITGTQTQVELKVRNATCSAWDFNCFYAANQSNLSGFYTVGCLEAGNYSVMAFGGGGPGQQGSGLMMQPTNISITNASITGFDLNLTRDERGPQGCGQNASISGYVMVNNSGIISFLSNVNVFAGKSDMSGSGGPMSPGDFCGGGAQTDSNGLYNITGLKAGSYMLNVMPSQGSGYSEVHLPPEQAITLANNSSTSEKNFTLARAGFVVGYVYGNNSGGCASNGSGCAIISGAFVNIYEPRPGGAWGGGSTDANGFFNISVTPGNGYELSVNPPPGSAYATYRISPFDGGAGVDISEGATTNISQVFGAIILRQGARITGRVMNSTGQGIQNVGVNAHPKNMFGPGGEWGFSQTDSNGTFTISGLKANSTYVVEAFPFDPNSNYSSGSAEATLSDTGATVNITLVQGNSVSGRVTCNGSNVSFAQVQFIKLEAGAGERGPEKMFGSMEAGRFAFAMADQNGLYSARGITVGNYSLRAELQWGSSAYNCSANTSTVAIIAGDNPLNIMLPSAVTVSGKVNDSEGNNVANAFVNAFQPSTTGGPGSGPSAFAQTDSNGNYAMRLAPNAEYIISVFPPWGSTYASQEVRRNISSTTTQNFTLSSGGSIRGKLVDSGGTAIQFAFVNAFSESVRSFGFTNTQSDGSFEVRGLSSAADFRLFIQPPPNSGGILPTFLERISVVSGQATDVGTINATSSTSYLLVTVLDGDTPIQSANVHAWLPSTPYFGYCTTNSTGGCNISGLAEGAYDIFVDASGRPPAFSNKSVVAGSNSFTYNYNASGTLYTLNGTVQNITGGGIADAEVGVWDEATRFGMRTTANASGFFSFTGVPSGTYKLGSRQPGYFDNVSSVTVASLNKTQNITLGSATASGGTLVTVSGYLISQSNSSVATKTVLIVDAASASLYSSFNVTNSSGYYSIANVPAPSSGAYNYVLTAVMGNQTFSATWASNASTQVNITVS